MNSPAKCLAAAMILAAALTAPAMTFRDFSGTCQGGDLSSPLWQYIGWNRWDLSWVAAEPAPGRWNEAYLRQYCEKVRRNLERGIKVVPVLAYAPGWASLKTPHEFTDGDSRTVYTPLDGKSGSYLKATYRKQQGQWVLQKESEVRNPRIPLDPAHCEDWKNFVRKAVTLLRAEPYNIEYFGIWNEAHPKSGFWDGSLDVYMQTIHLPAAEVIHELGGKVVYGGYPCCGTVDQLQKLLDRNRAWQSIDVLDIHYYPEWCMDYLRRAAARNGRPEMGVWQTEIGFHRNYHYVATFYPTVLYWALTHNRNDPDRYKVFYFALGSPDAPAAYGYGKNLMAGRQLTPHGKALETLGGLFGDAEIAPYSSFSTTPELKFAMRDSRISGFIAGKRIIVCPVFDSRKLKEFETRNTAFLSIRFPELPRGRIAAARRVGIFGETLDLTGALRSEAAGVSLQVPMTEAESGNHTDKFLPPAKSAGRRPAFYVVLDLK